MTETYYLSKERAYALKDYIGDDVVISESDREYVNDEVKVDIEIDGLVALQMFHAGIKLGMKIVEKIIV